MSRICKNCSFENKDEYDFCAKCGTPLVEGLQPSQIYVVRREEQTQINKKAMALAYIVTIVLSFSGFICGLLFKNATYGTFTFFGIFMPFYFIQAPIKEIRKHGIILMVISIIGVALSLYTMFNLSS